MVYFIINTPNIGHMLEAFRDKKKKSLKYKPPSLEND